MTKHENLTNLFKCLVDNITFIHSLMYHDDIINNMDSIIPIVRECAASIRKLNQHIENIATHEDLAAQ